MSYIAKIRLFVRVVELGTLSAAGHDQRLTPAVASNRILDLEKQLGIRLFNRTTRTLSPTEAGRLYYESAKRIIEAVHEGEAVVADLSRYPKGVLRVTAPLGIGRRLIASGVPDFHEKYPGIEVQLRLSDHSIDVFHEGADVAFGLGTFSNSSLLMRGIVNCTRVLCAAPEYLSRRGIPVTPSALVEERHHCLLLRYPGSTEHVWLLESRDRPVKLRVWGPYDCDDGDVLTDWALEGCGIVNKPFFEVKAHLESGRLVEILKEAPPIPALLAAFYPHKRLQDPKARLLIDFMAKRCKHLIDALLEGNTCKRGKVW